MSWEQEWKRRAERRRKALGMENAPHFGRIFDELTRREPEACMSRLRRVSATWRSRLAFRLACALDGRPVFVYDQARGTR